MKISIVRIIILTVLVTGKISLGYSQIIGPSKVCNGDTIQYFVYNGKVPTGNWTIPPSYTLISYKGIDTINVRVGTGLDTIRYNSNTAIIFQKPVIVNLKPLLDVSVTPSNGACSGEPILLKGTGANSYTWNSPVLDSIPFKPLYSNFTSPSYFPINAFAGGQIVDVDGDGLEDMVAYNRVYRNTGNTDQPVYQVFSNPIYLSQNSSPIIQDLNNDGKPELIYLEKTYPSKIHVYWNKCDTGNLSGSSFSDIVLQCSMGLRSIQVIDINNDGKKDILGLADSDASQTDYFYNNSTPSSILVSSFNKVYYYPVSPNFLLNSISADMDNDGRGDLIYTNYTSIMVALNKGKAGEIQMHSSFQSSVILPDLWVYQSAPTKFVLSDLNSDGLVDILYFQHGIYNLIVAWNKSKPGQLIFEKQSILTGFLPGNSLSVQDFDDDGKKDISFDYVSGSGSQHSNLIIRNNYDLNLPKTQWFKDTFSLFWGDLNWLQFSFDLNKDGLKDVIKCGQSWSGTRLALPKKYVLTGLDTNGCKASKEIELLPRFGSPISLECTKRNLLCNSDSLLIIVKGSGIANFSWHRNGHPIPSYSNDSIWFKEKGTLNVISTAINGCSIKSNTIRVETLKRPLQANLDPKETICLNTVPKELFCQSDTAVYLKYLWQEKKYQDTAWVNIGTTEKLILAPQNEFKFFRRIIYEDNCFFTDTSNYKELKFYAEPIALFDVNQYIQCFSGHQFEFTSQILDTSARQISYWSFSDGSRDTGNFVIKQFEKNKNYQATLIVKTKDNCIDSMQTNVGFINNNLPVAICMVSIDTTLNKNAVVFSRLNSTSISGYQIYKEGIVAGTYEPLAIQSAMVPGYFVDTNSFPSTKADRYKIASIDSCGNIGPISAAHKTLHLSISQGLNNSNTLIWQPYEGNTVQTTRIYRGPSPSNLNLLQEMQGNLFQFTDVNPLVGANYYQISLDFGKICDTDIKLKRLISQTLSNISSDKLNSLQNLFSPQNCKIYPNPFKSELQVDLTKLNNGTTVKIFDISGKQVFIRHISKLNETLLPELNAGLYWIELSTNNLPFYRQTIIRE